MYDPSGGSRGQGYGGGYGHPADMNHMTDQMGGMDLNGQRPAPPGSRGSAESHNSQGAYGRPQMNGRGPPSRGPPQGHYDPRAPQPHAPDSGNYGGFDDGYNRGGPANHEFGPPSRSMTMPLDETQRSNTAPLNGPGGWGAPPRPSSAADHRRPPPQRYSPENQGYQYDQYGGGYDDGQGYGQHQQQPPPPQQRGSYDQPYGDYYDDGRQGYQGQATQRGMHTSQTSLPDFNMIDNKRGSFEQTLRPGAEQPQRVAHQTAVLNHAQSQPDLRQPQAAVFEMAGDIPSVPPIPPVGSAAARHGPGPGGPGAHERMPRRGPSAPPGATNIPGPSAMGPPSVMSDPVMQSKNPDALPSHPTPVRAGLMADSVVNMKAKPPPVRNYGGVAQAQPQQQQPRQMPPQRQLTTPAPTPSRGPAAKIPEAPVTPQELEQLRMVIKNNPNDQESALRLARRLIEAADVLVPGLPDPKTRGRARERYIMDAHKILKKLANAQNMEAMFTMADSLGRGLFGGDGDTKEAFTLYQSAAKLGHPGAAYRTAVCCEIGQDEGGGTRKDPMKAIQWYKRAASLGDTPAMYKVGMILLKGLLGQPRNPREAVGWLKRAAERADADNPHALHELGLLYESAQPNDTIIKDERYALSLFEQAADLGYKYSQFRLGCVFEYGLLGCPVDPTMSIMWYSKAAQREEHQAELALSGWYLTGSDGVLKQSDQEAYLWARKAAIAGLAKAEYAMGYFTEVGIGTPANLEDAKRWYWRAAGKLTTCPGILAHCISSFHANIRLRL